MGRHRGTPCRTWPICSAAVVGVWLLLTAAAAPPGERGGPPAQEPPASHGETSAEAGRGLVDVAARVVNFAILAGVLVYLFRSPLVAHLTARRDAIRRELAEARHLQETAARQIEALEARQRALPQEIEALRARGAAEIAAEERRILELAELERRRVLEQAHREVDLMLRVARRELVRIASDLAVAAARERLRAHVTPADQERLVVRYLDQIEEVRR
jgi:F-type H+-transporting ATPase subunit b